MFPTIVLEVSNQNEYFRTGVSLCNRSIYLCSISSKRRVPSPILIFFIGMNTIIQARHVLVLDCYVQTADFLSLYVSILVFNSLDRSFCVCGEGFTILIIYILAVVDCFLRVVISQSCSYCVASLEYPMQCIAVCVIP